MSHNCLADLLSPMIAAATTEQLETLLSLIQRGQWDVETLCLFRARVLPEMRIRGHVLRASLSMQGDDLQPSTILH